MNKKDLDALKELYSSVYDEEQLSEKSPFGLNPLDYLPSNSPDAVSQRQRLGQEGKAQRERERVTRATNQRAQLGVVKTNKGYVANDSTAYDGDKSAQAVGLANRLNEETGLGKPPTKPTPATTPVAAERQRPAAGSGSTPPPRPAARPSGPVLSKKDGVEGTGVGANFKARGFTAAEKTRYSSVAAQNAAKSSASSGTPKSSSPTPAASATPKPAIGMLGKTSFERRTPTSAELSAAQSAPKGSTPEQRLQAAKNVGVASKPATPGSNSINNTKKPMTSGSVTQANSYEWPSAKTIKDIAGAYASIYEAKSKEVDSSRDKDGDGDNDFADNMIARMVASGMSREEAIKKVKNKEYNKEEYSLDEETKAEKGARIAARRARVKQMEDEGAVMTSSRRAREVAKQRKEDKKAEALERAGSAVLNQMRGASGRVSERPMGSEAPKAKEKAPEATRRLNPNLRKDNLGSAADRVLKSIKKEELELWVNGLIEEGYDLSEYTWDEMAEIYLDEATAMAKRGYNETKIRNKIARNTKGGESADRATELENIPTYGDKSKQAAREKLARSQRGDFRRTTSSDYGLRGYGYQSNDPAVKAKQAARGKQRSPLTPKEKKMLNKEAYETYEFVASYLLENNFASTVNDANVIINNMSEGWFDQIIEG